VSKSLNASRISSLWSAVRRAIVVVERVCGGAACGDSRKFAAASARPAAGGGVARHVRSRHFFFTTAMAQIAPPGGFTDVTGHRTIGSWRDLAPIRPPPRPSQPEGLGALEALASSPARHHPERVLMLDAERRTCRRLRATSSAPRARSPPTMRR
jgi:hypothetical protein